MTEGAINKVLYNVDQRADTTDAEKKTARDNIGALGAEDIPSVVDDRYKLLQYPIDQTYASYAVIDRFTQDRQGVATVHCSYLTVATDSSNGLMGASDKAKLNTVSYNAEQNVQADWDETDPSSDAYIRNKPSQSVQVQSDWDETNTTLPSFIRNKPTIPSGDQLLPAATSADENKVLVVDENGHPVWEDAGSGLVSVAHDTTLTGDGTNSSPLSVNTNNIQEKLTPGTGITIQNNVISAAAALTPGNGIQIVNDVVSARVDGTSIDFDQAGNLSVKSPLVLNGQGTQTVVGGNGLSVENTTTHASTTINYGGVTLSDGTNSDTFDLGDLQKLDGIQSGAEANVQADWNQTDTTADDYIKNKPNVLQIQSDWTQTDSSAVDFIKHKPNLATVATTGEYSDLLHIPDLTQYKTKQGVIDQSYAQFAMIDRYTQDTNGIVDIHCSYLTVATSQAAGLLDPSDKAKLDNVQAGAEVNVQSDWAQTNSAADDFIKNKPTNLVQDPNYVHTDNNFTTSEKTKLAGVQAGAEQNVQSDWAQTNSSADDFIKNKPVIPVVPPMKELVAGTGITIVDDDYEVTISSEMSAADKAKLDGIEAGAEVNVQADWTQADSTADDFIKNKPANLVQDANYVHTDNNFTNSFKNKLNNIQAGAEVNVQSDWNVTNTSSDAFIRNKPSIPSKTSDLTNDSGFITASQVPPQANADWNESDPTDPAYIENKPDIPEITWTQNNQGSTVVTEADTLDINQDTHHVQMSAGSSTVDLGFTVPPMASAPQEDMFLSMATGNLVPTWTTAPETHTFGFIDVVL